MSDACPINPVLEYHRGTELGTLPSQHNFSGVSFYSQPSQGSQRLPHLLSIIAARPTARLYLNGFNRTSSIQTAVQCWAHWALLRTFEYGRVFCPPLKGMYHMSTWSSFRTGLCWRSHGTLKRSTKTKLLSKVIDHMECWVVWPVYQPRTSTFVILVGDWYWLFWKQRLASLKMLLGSFLVLWGLAELYLQGNSNTRSPLP